jgi:glycosyltransferase involved in cell wall biosynthesis
MSTNHEIVTIGITCYNAAHTIERAILSAQWQAWENLEIIVVDDNSSDNSVDIVEQAIFADPRARLIRHTENRGAAGARNTIIAAARGAFIAFFDDDDESDPQRVARQVETISSFESDHSGALVACYASGKRLYPNGYVKLLPAIGVKSSAPSGEEVANYLLFYAKPAGRDFGSGTPTCALMARRDVFEQLEGFDASLRRVEDVDFAIRLALAGGHFVGTIAPLFQQFATEGSDKSPEANRDAEVSLAKKHERYLRSIGYFHYALHWPMLRYLHHKRRYVAFAGQFLRILLRNPRQALSHLLATGPRRLRHERNMRRPR